MSKLCDVQRMYGQDFGIAVTNASSYVVANSSKLLSNMLVISSPSDKNGDDAGYPALFATDYNGKPVQLTYAISIDNGLALDTNNIMYLNIDKQTIKQKYDGAPLSVDTNYLTLSSFNNVGVSKVANEIRRENIGPLYPQKTFISVNEYGVLYISDSFFEYIDSKINRAIATAVSPLISKTTRSWIEVVDETNQNVVSKYYETDTIPIVSTNLGIITKTISLHYTTSYKEPQRVEIDNQNVSGYPWMSVVYDEYTTVENEDNPTDIGGIYVYEHVINNIILQFYPNYYVDQSSITKPINYKLAITENADLDSPVPVMFNVIQYGGVQIRFDNITQSLPLFLLENENPVVFTFVYENLIYNNELANANFFYTLELKHNGLTLYSGDISEEISSNANGTIDIQISKETDETTYNAFKNYLINSSNNGDEEKQIIEINPNASTVYSYKFTININGETYNIEKSFTISYNRSRQYSDNVFLWADSQTRFQAKTFDSDENDELPSIFGFINSDNTTFEINANQSSEDLSFKLGFGTANSSELLNNLGTESIEILDSIYNSLKIKPTPDGDEILFDKSYGPGESDYYYINLVPRIQINKSEFFANEMVAEFIVDSPYHYSELTKFTINYNFNGISDTIKKSGWIYRYINNNSTTDSNEESMLKIRYTVGGVNNYDVNRKYGQDVNESKIHTNIALNAGSESLSGQNISSNEDVSIFLVLDLSKLNTNYNIALKEYKVDNAENWTIISGNANAFVLNLGTLAWLKTIEGGEITKSIKIKLSYGTGYLEVDLGNFNISVGNLDFTPSTPDPQTEGEGGGN